MTTDQTGILLLASVLAVGYLLVEFASHATVTDPDPEPDSEPVNEWMPDWTHPIVPGWHHTRFYINHIQTHEMAFWDGECWRYGPDKHDCYFQKREWKAE